MMIFDHLLVTMCSCCFQYPTRRMFSLCISTENAVKVQKNDPFTSGHQFLLKKTTKFLIVFGSIQLLQALGFKLHCSDGSVQFTNAFVCGFPGGGNKQDQGLM